MSLRKTLFYFGVNSKWIDFDASKSSQRGELTKCTNLMFISNQNVCLGYMAISSK